MHSSKVFPHTLQRFVKARLLHEAQGKAQNRLERRFGYQPQCALSRAFVSAEVFTMKVQ